MELRERVARYLHRLMSPRGEDVAADWDRASPQRRNMYFAEADYVIALTRGDGAEEDEHA